jgi:hypothetical protein
LREQKIDERWTDYFDMQNINLKIKIAIVETERIILDFWTPTFRGYKNAEAAKILPTDTSNIVPKTKVWFDGACT